LLVERFTSEYQELLEEMNLVQIWHTGPLKAYVLNLNAPTNVTPKRNNFAKRCIFLGEVAKVGGECLVQFPKLFEDMVRIIKIAKDIEIDGPVSQPSLAPFD
jgi:hypothetical protein